MFFMIGFSRKMCWVRIFYSSKASLNLVAFLISMLKENYF